MLRGIKGSQNIANIKGISRTLLRTEKIVDRTGSEIIGCGHCTADYHTQHTGQLKSYQQDGCIWVTLSFGCSLALLGSRR